jgi:hypothetical protein
MPEQDWNKGYKRGIADAIKAVDRLNIDDRTKVVIRHKIKKMLISINASEPKKKLHELNINVEADIDG